MTSLNSISHLKSDGLSPLSGDESVAEIRSTVSKNFLKAANTMVKVSKCLEIPLSA